METRKGSFGIVSIDKLARTVTKKQPMYDTSLALDLCTLTDCVMSAFVAATDSIGLPSLDDVRVLRDKHKVEMDMPYYGVSLHDWIRNTTRPQRIAMLPTIIFQLVDACTYLLDNDLQHTDIKPANILIDDLAKVTLIDFNIYSVRTITGWVDSVGTWCFVAPEILHSDSPHTNSMVWSIGLIIAEICCGYPLGSLEKLTTNINDRRQWQSLMRRMEKNHKSGLPMSTTHCSNIPTNYVKLYNQCTRWNPDERPSLNDLLQQVSATELSKQSRAICFTVVPSRSMRRNQIIDKIHAFCTSHKGLTALFYRSIWLFDSYDHDDDHSIAGCIGLAYTMFGFTVDDGFVNGLNALVTTTQKVRAADIEDAMLNICVTLDWQLYDKAADMLALSAGIKEKDIITSLPIVMKKLDGPYDGIIVAEALFKECCDMHKEEGEREGYASIGRNKHFSGIRRCEPRHTCMATYDETVVENKASA